MSDAQHLFKLATSLAKFLDDNEKTSLPLFSVKLVQAHRTYPEDHTIGMMSSIVEKMANSDKLFITRAEIRDLYEKFYSKNTKFASVFVEEMGQPVAVEKPLAVAEENNMVDLINQSRNELIDPVLASALDQAFGGNTVKNYKSSLAVRASQTCANKFKNWGLTVVASDIMCAQDDVFICNVAVETPRGTTSVLVPTEALDGQMMAEPVVFVGNDGATDLNKNTVVAYLTSRAGQKLIINAAEVLQAAVVAKDAQQEVSDVDLALIRLNHKETAHCLGQQVMGVEVETVNPNLILQVPVVKDERFETIANSFGSELGFANFKFGDKIVAEGRRLVAKQLDQCGLSNYAIAVLACSDNTITYSVNANNGMVAFKAPIKVEANNVFPPAVLICDGAISNFDKTAITSMLRSNGFDRAAAVSASPLYGVKPSELVNTVRAAVSEKNYAKAEDALNILASGEDEKAYQIAMSLFTRGLGEKETEVVAEPTNKCTMVVKSANSQFDLCGHTGLPLHQITQDKHGHCMVPYRQNMDVSYEGVNFMHTKVYL